MAAGRTVHLGLKRTVFVGVLAVCLWLGVATVIANAADFGKVRKALGDADPIWLPFSLLGEVIAYGGYTLAFREAARLDGGPVLRAWTALRVVAASFGAFIVATAAGGIAVGYWALRRAGEGRRSALSRILALNILQWAVLGGAACFSATALLLGAPGDAPLAMLITWLVVVPVCFAGGLFVSSPRRREELAREHGGRIRRLFGVAVDALVLARAAVFRPQRNGAVLGAALYWFGDLLCLWAALRAFGVDTEVPALIAAYTTGYVATALPLPAGGTGGIDASMTYALSLVGVPLATALLATFTFRFFAFWLPIVPALLVLPGLRRLREELPQSAAAEQAGPA